MLILTEKDIKYCQLRDEESYPQKTYSGIFYRGFTFVPVASYTNDRLQQAIAKARQFLEKEEPIVSIIIKEKNNLTLWTETDRLDLIVLE